MSMSAPHREVHVASLHVCGTTAVHNYGNMEVLFKPLMPKFLLLNFSIKFLKKLLLCEKIPHERSYLDILNGNQDIND
jgi:hypothetical protein